MTRRLIKPIFAKMDPAHVFDGLFVPTKGKSRGRLLVKPRSFGPVKIGFQGPFQLGADDQSILLAIAAQLGTDGLIIEDNPEGPISRQLRLDIRLRPDDGVPLASKRTTLRSLAITAGYYPEKSTNWVKESLNRLRSAQIREIDQAGWDRVCNIVSVAFNESGDTYIAANPRLTSAVFRGQHIKVSLSERAVLESEVSKILHCWLCSNIRPGQSLGHGNGAHIDTLGPHIWGQEAWSGLSRASRSKKRGQIRDALDEIADRTRHLHNGMGWVIDQTSSGLVLVSRPKRLPTAEGLPAAGQGLANQYYSPRWKQP